MTISNNSTRVKGDQAFSIIVNADSKRKTTVSTTATVVEGVLTFPSKKEDWEIIELSYKAKSGENRTFPAVVCKDSADNEHAIALSAFVEKQPVVGIQGEIIPTDNICPIGSTYTEIWNTLQRIIVDDNNAIAIHRTKGKRNNFYGRYEYFEVVEIPTTTTTTKARTRK